MCVCDKYLYYTCDKLLWHDEDSDLKMHFPDMPYLEKKKTLKIAFAAQIPENRVQYFESGSHQVNASACTCKGVIRACRSCLFKFLYTDIRGPIRLFKTEVSQVPRKSVLH